MNWRHLNRAVHRDLGYLCCGLTLIYVISGVAVNHIDRWNPSYRLTRIESNIGSLKDVPREDLVPEIMLRVGETRQLKNVFSSAPDELTVFAEGNTIVVNLHSGSAVQERYLPRSFLYEVNFLHLNHPKKLWTWFADLYAVGLGLLAISGLFVLQGRQGMKGRGAVLVAAGVSVPLFFLWLYL
ncbi:MAG: PepSY-associated TM helix domain-containing protein [Desulfuromonadales bacterium]|nr:PepSY-associated TM helix domain-containing protein [Desulfuromonadales bacterium]